MTGTLLPLLVAVPLLAAAAGVVIRSLTLLRLMHVGVSLASMLAGVALLVEHAETPVISHHVGNFVPGVAIVFVSDTFTALMITVTGITTTVVSLFTVVSGESRLRYFQALALMLTGGVNGALLTGDLFNLFVFIEVMLLPSYALIAITGTWRRLGVGRLFVVVNLTTSTILLAGVGLVYGVAGSVNLAVLNGAAARDDRVAVAGAVVLLALAIKAGIVPLHSWLPRAYPATSAGVMAMFSALHTKVALYAIYRVYSVVYDGDQRWSPLLLTLAAVTMLVGAVSSFGEKTIRRMLSFQMVAGVGYIVVGVALSSRLGLAAGMFYMSHHIIAMGSLLLGAGAIERTYAGHFPRLSGLMRRDPLFSVVFALGLMSLVGFPPSSGFFGKVGIVRALAQVDSTVGWIVLAVVVLASIASLVALQHLWREAFWGQPMEDTVRKKAKRAKGDTDSQTSVEVEPVFIQVRTYAPAAALLLVSLAVFVFAGPVFDICLRAADGLVDTSAYVAEVLG